jgi:ribosomal protein L18
MPESHAGERLRHERFDYRTRSSVVAQPRLIVVRSPKANYAVAVL